MDSDEEEEASKSEARMGKLRERLCKDGAMTGKAKNKAKRALRRASKSTTKTKVSFTTSPLLSSLPLLFPQ